MPLLVLVPLDSAGDDLLQLVKPIDKGRQDIHLAASYACTS
jgi:hypothetical protein